MTRDYDDIEQIVRRTLASHAGRPDDVRDDLADRAISRGRVVRRRRQTAGAVAAGVAAVAVAGGVWGVFGQALRPADPMPAARPSATPTATDAQAADSGPAGVVPRADLTASGVVLRLPGRTVPLGGTVRSVVQVAAAGADTLVLGSDRASAAEPGGTQTLLVVPAKGDPRVVASGSLTSFVALPAGRQVAYVGAAAGGQAQVRVRDLATGQLVRSADLPQGVTGTVRASAAEGSTVLLTEQLDQAGRVYEWTVDGRMSEVRDLAAAYPVPGGSPLVVTQAAGGRQCLRTFGSGHDIVCGATLAVSASRDGKQALVHSSTSGGQGGEQLDRVDLGTGTVTRLAVPQALRSGQEPAAAWRSTTWTVSGVPLVPAVAKDGTTTWSSVDMRSGTATARPLPTGATKTILW